MLASWFRHWWWVLCFSIVAVSVYFHNIQDKKAKLKDLSFRLEEMNQEKSHAFAEREILRGTIASQSDPSWIEMVLMRDLGVVPEGWLKVHFTR